MGLPLLHQSQTRVYAGLQRDSKDMDEELLRVPPFGQLLLPTTERRREHDNIQLRVSILLRRNGLRHRRGQSALSLTLTLTNPNLDPDPDPNPDPDPDPKPHRPRHRRVQWAAS